MKFQLGDHVQIVSSTCGISVGEIGIVLALGNLAGYQNDRYVGVEFQTWNRGHDLYLRTYPLRPCKPSHGYYVPIDWIELCETGRLISMPCPCNSACLNCNFTGILTFFSNRENTVNDTRYENLYNIKEET